MSVKCQIIIDALETLAPLHLAENWDNVGLLLGAPEKDVTKVLVALDVDDQVVQEAITVGAQLIISHHPLIFKGLTSLRTDTPLGRRLATLLHHHVSVYTAHTNLDTAIGGVNDALAQCLGLIDAKSLRVSQREALIKIVVFVPLSYGERVWQAMAGAGAGHIGNYSHCSFRTKGVGTFLPLAGTKPFIGQAGKCEEVEELRIETIVPEYAVKPVIQAMRAAHPYEEVAFDEYPLHSTGREFGLGRVGHLPVPQSLEGLIQRVKEVLNISSVNVAGHCATAISKVAVCGGSGAGFISHACAAGAQVLITGDVKYHEAQEAVAAGLVLVDAGHFATEFPVVSHLSNYLKHQAVHDSWDLNPQNILEAKEQKDVFRII